MSRGPRRPPPPATLPEGCAGWRILQPLGKGGQSATLLIQNDAGEQRVFKRPKSHDPKALARARREIQILRTIEHPNVVPILAASEPADEPWCALPLGEPLHEYWYARRAGLTTAQLFDESEKIVFGLVDGLEAVHAHDVVHRDIKPQNVIMVAGVPKLIDFGIAWLDDDESDRLTSVDETTINSLTPPGPWAYGRMESPPKGLDCAGMAWLWAWLLAVGSDPRWGKYHHAHHRMIDDERCDLVRLVLGICSNERTMPSSVAAFRALAGRLHLGPAVRTAAGAAPGDTFAAVGAAHRMAATELELQRLDRADQVGAAAGLLGRIYKEIIDGIATVVTQASGAGLPVEVSMHQDSVESMLRRDVVPERYRFVQLFGCRLGNGVCTAEIWAVLCDTRGDPDLLPLRLELRFQTGPFGALGGTVYYVHDRSGGCWLLKLPGGERENVPDAHPVKHVEAWLNTRELWDAVRRT